MKSRCPSARFVGTSKLEGWRAVFDKPSIDASSKRNLRPDPRGVTEGVVWEISDDERKTLDVAEHRYDPIETDAGLTYVYSGPPTDSLPYDWYASTVERGAQQHGLEPPSTTSAPDSLAPGIRPADESDLPLIQDILSDGLSAGGDRYFSHPGEAGWWMHHADERYPLIWWVQGEDAFSVIDRSRDREIFVFARPGKPLLPMVEWSRRFLGGKGEVAWVSEHDSDLESDLRHRRLEPVFSFLAYEWHLNRDRVPDPVLPDGWSIRAVGGEDEASERRRASHAAFESSMEPQDHLDRYLAFMRSPVYEAERDLVAVRDDGRIGAFMIW